jgi:hypothetical protein
MQGRKLLWLVLFLLVAASPLAAQTTGGLITGTVQDPQGGVVPGATATLTDAGRNTSQSVVTDDTGVFVFPQVLPARYTLTVEMVGFKKYGQRDLVLNINDRLSLGRITLEVGEVQQTVEVSSEGLRLQTESAERTGTIVGEQLQNIQVNGRSPLALLRVLPGIVTNYDSSRANNRIQDIYINGARGNSLNATINGVSVTGTGDNTKLMATVSLDSLQEFKVLASNYQAQYGKSAGGTIMYVTKSGTSDFHGSAYTYYRDRGMNANSWISNRDGVRKSYYHYNYYGYTIGGPAYIPGKFNTNKDKLFFFWSEEYQRQLIPEGLRRVTVPTELERAGDFSQSVDRNKAAFPYIRDPLATSRNCKASDTSGCFSDGGVLGRIPANRLYAPGVALLKIFPLPNVTGQAGYNYISSISSSNPRHERLLRLDSNLNQNWRLFGSYTQLVQDTENSAYGAQGYSITPNYPLSGGVHYNHPGYALALNLLTTLSPTSTNEVTFGTTHHDVTTGPRKESDVTRAGTGVNLPTLYEPYADWIPEFAFGGSRLANTPDLRTGGGSFAPFYTYNTTIEFADNYSKLWKEHFIKAGMYVQRNRKNQSAFVQSGGDYNFGDSGSNPLDTGFGFANSAVGVYSSFTQASDYLMGMYRYTNLEMYLQDTWKVTPKVTLDVGLRAYWIQPQYDAGLHTSTFSPGKFDPSKAPRLYWPCWVGGSQKACDYPTVMPGQTPNPGLTPAEVRSSLDIGKFVPGSGDEANGILPGGEGISKYLMREPGLLWAPRLGLAIDLTGSGNLVFRAGAGAFYDRYQGNEIFNTITNPPSIFTPTALNGFVSQIASAGALTRPSNLTVMSYAGEIPTVYNYSAGLQTKLPWALVMDVSYVGSLGRQLLYNRNINAAPYGTAFKAENQDPTKSSGTVPAGPYDGSRGYDSDFVRPYRGHSNITLQDFGATSNYNSLQITVDRRFAKGLFLGTSYTWGKCLTIASSDGDGGRIDDLTRLANYGPCSYDVTQNFTFNYIYQIPGVTGHGSLDNAVTRAILDGWQVSGISVFRTGQPMTPGFSISGVSGVMLTGSGAVGARVKLVGDPTAGTSDDPYNRLTAAAFAPPTRPSLGLESPVNFVRGPGWNNWDMSLQRNVNVTEKTRLEFRVDAFNVFNHTQFSGLNSTINFKSYTDATVMNLPYDASGNLVNKTGFGTVSGSRSPRVLQLVARFVF